MLPMALTLRIKCACNKEVWETYNGVPAPGASGLMWLRQRLCNHAEMKGCVGGNVGAYVQQLPVEACWEGQVVWSLYTPPPLLALPPPPLPASIVRGIGDIGASSSSSYTAGGMGVMDGMGGTGGMGGMGGMGTSSMGGGNSSYDHSQQLGHMQGMLRQLLEQVEQLRRQQQVLQEQVQQLLPQQGSADGAADAAAAAAAAAAPPGLVPGSSAAPSAAPGDAAEAEYFVLYEA